MAFKSKARSCVSKPTAVLSAGLTSGVRISDQHIGTVFAHSVRQALDRLLADWK
jgi:hypothetical protein